MKKKRYLFILIFFSFFIFQKSSAELLKPNNKFKPIEVVKIQLNALQNNNNPYQNSGIKQNLVCWILNYKKIKKIKCLHINWPVNF